jgi:hypothetical protein
MYKPLCKKCKERIEGGVIYASPKGSVCKDCFRNIQKEIAIEKNAKTKFTPKELREIPVI